MDGENTGLQPVEQQPTGAAQAPAETPQPTEIPSKPSISREQLLEALKANPDLLAETDIYEIPPLRSKVDRVTNKAREDALRQARERAEQEAKQQAERQAQLAQARQFAIWYEGLTDAQRGQLALQHPDYAEQYKQAKVILADPDAKIAERVANNIWQGAKKLLVEKYAGPDYDKAETLEEVIEMAAEAKIDIERKTLKEELEAFKKEMLGKIQAASDQPERGTAQGGAAGTMSLEEVVAAYADGKIDTATYEREMKKYGQKPGY